MTQRGTLTLRTPLGVCVRVNAPVRSNKSVKEVFIMSENFKGSSLKRFTRSAQGKTTLPRYDATEKVTPDPNVVNAYGMRIHLGLASACELMLMGKVIPINNPDVNAVTRYVLNVMKASKPIVEDYERYAADGGDFLNEVIRKYSRENNVWGVCVNTLNLMGESARCVTFLLEEPNPDNEFGGAVYVPCYVLNVDWGDNGSEFGDCFFRFAADKFWHRVS